MMAGAHLAPHVDQPLVVEGEDARAVGLAVEFRAYKKSVLWQAVDALLANMQQGVAKNDDVEAVVMVNAPADDVA